MKKIFALLIFLAAFVALACASESVTHTSQISFFQRGLTYSTGASFSLSSTLSLPSSQPPQIFIPKSGERDDSDLPNLVYMCPGQLDLANTPDANFYLTSFSAGTPYILPRARNNFVCFASNDYPTCLATEWPWASGDLGYNSKIQFSTSPNPNILQRMESDTSKSATINEALWSEISTPANVNVNYYPSLSEDFYPNQQAKAGLVCSAYETSTLTSTGTVQLTRSDGRRSPAPLDTPLTSSKWSVPRMTDQMGDSFVLNGIRYFGTQYVISSDIQTQPACHGVVQLLPFANDALDAKHFYTLGSMGFSTPSPAQFTVRVVEPKTCGVSGTIISPSSLSNLQPNTEYNVELTIYNPYELFDLVATSVQIAAPTNGWTARESPSNQFPITIPSKESVKIPVIIKSPQQLTSEDDIVVQINFESAVPFCDGNKCKNYTTANIKIGPRPRCAIEARKAVASGNTKICDLTSPSVTGLSVAPGEDICFSATCYLDGYVSCPATMTWTPSGFDDGNGNNISLRSYPPYSKLMFYNPANPGRVLTVLNSQPQPTIVLYTYKELLLNSRLVTAPTDHGVVSASGTDNMGNKYDCLYPALSVQAVDKPDLVPNFLDGINDRRYFTPVAQPNSNINGHETYYVTYGAKNFGAGQASRFWVVMNISEGNKIDQYSFYVSSTLNYLDAKTVSPAVPFKCPNPGVYPVNVTVDPPPPEPNGNVAESKENNNRGYGSVINCGNVLACADII